MGTRHLICATVCDPSDQHISNKKFLLAQYGQWDGYPEGCGLKVLEFCRNFDPELFRFNLEQYEQVEKNYIPEESEVQFNRDTSHQILDLIYHNKLTTYKLYINKDFGKDELFCEWLYELDLTNGVLNVFSDGWKNLRASVNFDSSLTDPEFLRLF
jgi:hypothetical protein